jgi:aryl-alcohol dehydrogenase-like predicted oxidoreductase
MYQFSRAIYRELAPYISPPTGGTGGGNHEHVLHACEAAVERLATDRYYFARPARTLFCDIRTYFPMSAQERVHQVVTRYIGLAERYLQENPIAAYAAVSNKPLQCRATTRKGAACQRVPLPHNGYCPSHQHLADTEDREPLAA